MMRRRKNGWYEGATVDLLWILGVKMQTVEAFGGGNPSTPRSGMRVDDSSRFPRGNQGMMEEGWSHVIKDGEKENTGKKDK